MFRKFSNKKDTGYEVGQSLLFDGDSQTLNHTFQTWSSMKTFTFSAWVKKCSNNSPDTDFQYLISAGIDVNNWTGLYFHEEKLKFASTTGGSPIIRKFSTQVFRDSSSWYHICVSMDTTNPVAEDRVKVYVNGERLTDFYREDDPPQNYDGWFGSNHLHKIGQEVYSSGNSFDGYMADVHFINGQQLGPEHFALTDSNGVYNPIPYSGTYGANGFYLPFSGTGADWFSDSSSSHHKIAANGGVVNSTAQKKIGSSSIKFNGGGDYLSIAHPGWDWESSWTVDFWVRFSSLSSNNITLWSQNSNQGSPKIRAYYDPTASSGTLTLNHWGSTNESLQAMNLGLSTDTWYHFEFVQNGASSPYIFVDGTLQISGTWSDTSCNPSHVFEIGRENYESGNHLDGYIDEFRTSNTARHTSSFTPSTTEYSADSNTLLLIHSDWSSDEGVGKDHSGNDNDFTPSGLTSESVVADSPSNNYATLNPLVRPYETITLSEGNLQANKSSNGWSLSVASMGASSGKWYWECLLSNDSGNMGVGLVSSNADKVWNSGSAAQNEDGSLYYNVQGDLLINNSYVSPKYGDSYTTGDVISVALDMDASTPTITFYKNNVSQGTEDLSGKFLTANQIFPDIALYGTGEWSVNFGQRSWAHQPPSGYNALCTKNLPDPLVNPKEHFKAVTYTGGASFSKIETGFPVDFNWIKARTVPSPYEHVLSDSVRGVGKYLMSNTTDEEIDNPNTVTSFDSDGVTIGQDWIVNADAISYVSWNFRGGDTVTNNDGSIPSEVSANKDMGFSVVSYSGSSPLATVGHGLGSVPAMIILKCLDDPNEWPVGASVIASDWSSYLRLDESRALLRDDRIFNDTAPNSSVFTVGSFDGSNLTGHEYIAYCFTNNEMLQVGSYVGNGVEDGPMVNLPMKPAFLLIKGIDGGAGYHWQMADNTRSPFNLVDNNLLADLAEVEGHTWSSKDFLSNGFKIRSENSSLNGLGQRFLYLAIAEQNFKHARGR